MTIEITADVPIPALPPRVSPLTAALRTMAVGESFVAPQTDRRKLAATITTTAKSNGCKYTTRTQEDGTVRVWRVA